MKKSIKGPSVTRITRVDASHEQVENAICSYLDLFRGRLIYTRSNAARAWDAYGHVLKGRKQRVRTGWPDLTAVVRVRPTETTFAIGAQVLLIEVKTVRDRLSPSQADLLRELAALGTAIVIARSVNEVDAYMRLRFPWIFEGLHIELRKE